MLHDVPALLGFSSYGDRAVDFLVTVDVEATWIDANKEIKRSSVFAEPVQWTIEDVPLGRSKCVGRAVWVPSIPRSALSTGPGSGLYTVKVKIVESDDSAEILGEAAKALREKKDVVVQYVVVGNGSGSNPRGGTKSDPEEEGERRDG